MELGERQGWGGCDLNILGKGNTIDAIQQYSEGRAVSKLERETNRAHDLIPMQRGLHFANAPR